MYGENESFFALNLYKVADEDALFEYFEKVKVFFFLGFPAQFSTTFLQKQTFSTGKVFSFTSKSVAQLSKTLLVQKFTWCKIVTKTV